MPLTPGPGKHSVLSVPVSGGHMQSGQVILVMPMCICTMNRTSLTVYAQ